MHLELLKTHEHAGARLAAGATLHIDDDRGQWLIDIGVARRIKAARAAVAPVAAIQLPNPNSESPTPSQPDSTEEPTP